MLLYLILILPNRPPGLAVDRNHKTERSAPLVTTTEMPVGIAAVNQGITTLGIGTNGSTETIAGRDQEAEMHMRAGDTTDTMIPAEIAETVSDMAETAGTTMTAIGTLVATRAGVAAGITAGTTHVVLVTEMTLTRETGAGAETGTVEGRMQATNVSAPHPEAGPEAEMEDAIHHDRGQDHGRPPKMSEAPLLNHQTHRMALREL